MYTPFLFKETDSSLIYNFIKENSFATLVSVVKNIPMASHIPLFLNELKHESGVLYGHVSRENDIWRTFKSDQRVLAIFLGAHHYISSYMKSEDLTILPTWNYMSVHVYGQPKILSQEEFLEYLEHMMSYFEKDSCKPSHLGLHSETVIKNKMKGIVGFRIEIDKIEATFKLSQNRDEIVSSHIVTELKKEGCFFAQKISSEIERRQSDNLKTKASQDE